MLVIPDLLREFGVDPEPVFAKVGLPLHSLGNPDQPIAYRPMFALLSVCAKETACPHFGLLVGQRNGIDTLGLIGFLARNAPDVGSALRELVRHLGLHDRGASVDLKVSGDTAALCYEVDKPSSTGAREVHDTALAVMRNIMIALCGTHWKPSRVDFRRTRPDYVRPYQEVFQAPLAFGAGQNALVFSAAWLEAAIPQANPKLRQYLQDQVDEMSRRAQLDFQESAFQGVLAQVRKGSGSLEELATQFAIHPRTLNRRLQACGTSYRALQNKARHEIACELLRDTSSSIAAIAAELGYTSASAFTRAFSLWEGAPPGAWRKQDGLSAPA